MRPNKTLGSIGEIFWDAAEWGPRFWKGYAQVLRAKNQRFMSEGRFNLVLANPVACYLELPAAGACKAALAKARCAVTNPGSDKRYPCWTTPPAPPAKRQRGPPGPPPPPPPPPPPGGAPTPMDEDDPIRQGRYLHMEEWDMHKNWWLHTSWLEPAEVQYPV